MISNVSVIGGGKLGASMVAGMASRGFHVICIDKNPDVVDLLNAGRAPVFELVLKIWFRKTPTVLVNTRL